VGVSGILPNLVGRNIARFHEIIEAKSTIKMRIRGHVIAFRVREWDGAMAFQTARAVRPDGKRQQVRKPRFLHTKQQKS